MKKILFLVILIVVAGWSYMRFGQQSLIGEIAPSNKPLVIFDFDGIICDSFDEMVAAYNDLAPSFGTKILTPDLKEFYRTNSHKIIMKRLDVNWVKLPVLVYFMRKNVKARVPQMKTFPGMKACVKTLKDAGYRVGILTSNSLENVQSFLTREGFQKVDFIYHGSSMFGKARLLTQLVQKFGSKNVYYIGDENRDIEAAEKAEVKSVAVTWGYQGKKLLEKYKPDYLVSSPEELLRIFSKRAAILKAG